MIIQWYFIVNTVLEGQGPQVFDEGLGLESWYFALFSASVSTMTVAHGTIMGVRGAISTKCLSLEGIL